ncbi:MAG: hypothetical protein K8U57_34280 [Planctomycetes bacterium]|nr:hypothetical protein [Planctomycetota bacterium]
MRKHVLVLFAMIVLPGLAQAQRPTIREQDGSWLWKRFDEAPMLVVVRVQNAVKPNDDFPDGKVDLVIDEVLVPHAALQGRTSIVRPRYQEGFKTSQLGLEN